MSEEGKVREDKDDVRGRGRRNKNALCSHISLACLEIRSRNEEAINSTPNGIYYTCQLFLRYKREIFILGVLGFLKTTRSFPKIPEEVQSLPKTSEVLGRV